MYKCDKCGKVVEQLPLCKDTIDFDGYSYTVQEFGFNECKCGGEFEEAVRCPICGEWFIENTVDCCDKCFEENLNKETCIAIGHSSFDFNRFLRFVFSDEEIDEILEREFDKIDEGLKNFYFREFATDTYDFGSQVAERNRRENLHKRKN